jgi:hypothetical protein
MGSVISVRDPSESDSNFLNRATALIWQLHSIPNRKPEKLRGFCLHPSPLVKGLNRAITVKDWQLR